MPNVSTLSKSVKSALIAGAKGGSKASAPVEAPDSLHNVSLAHILDLVSEGEIRGFVNGMESVFLNETPLANPDGSLNFKNVQLDFRTGTQDQTHIPGIPDVENEVGIATELRSDTPWTRSFTNAALSAVSVRISVSALSKADTSNGNINGYTIEYAIDLSVDNGPWQTLITNAFSGKTTSKYERSHRIDLPSADAVWTVRVRRITANANSSSIADRTDIESVTEIIDAKLRYPNSALVGISIDAQQFPNIPNRAYDLYGRIVRVPSNYDPDTRAYAGVWDGTFKPAWTNNPAWVFYDLILHTRYGLGHLVDQSIPDKWALYGIGRYCDGMVSDGQGGLEPRFCCNLYLQKAGDAYKVLQDMTSVFRGLAYWASGSIITVADMPQDPTYCYTAANVIDGVFTYQGSAKKSRHTTALVSWNDMSDFGRAKVEYVEDAEGIERYGIQQLQVTAVGCTSRSQAIRLGKWMLLTERYETDTVTFNVGLDGAIAAPGQIILVADDLRAGKRIGGRIKSATINSITLDAPTDVFAGDTITVVMPDATAEKRTVNSVSEDNLTVTFSAQFSTAPIPHSVWVVESDKLGAQEYRVVKVTEADPSTFTITAIEHASGKFDEVEKGIKWDKPNITALPSKVMLAPSNIVIVISEVAGDVVAGTAVHVSWDPVAGAVSYDVEWRQNGSSWRAGGCTSECSIDIYGIASGNFEVRITAVSATGVKSTPARSNPELVPDQTKKPAALIRVEQSVADALTQLDQEVQDRAQADAAEAEARAEAIAAEATTRDSAIQDEATARTQAIADEAQARADAITDANLSITAQITTEQQSRQSADESLANAISTLTAGTSEQFDSRVVWYFDTDLEQWTGSGSPTVANGYLRPANGTDAYIMSPSGLNIDGDKYKYVKIRLRRTGNPTWSGKISWKVGDTWLDPITGTEPVFNSIDSDGTLNFKDLTWSGQIDQIRLDFGEQTATDYFEADWVAIGRPAPGSSTAALQDESQARITGDAAEAAQRSTLASQMRGNYDGTDVASLSSGLIYSERQARSTADEALATDISSLTARLDTSEASLVNELITRAGKDAVLVSSVNALDGRLTTAEGDITANGSALQSLETRMDSAEGSITSQSTQLTNLSSSLDALNESVTTNSSALSSLSTRVSDAEGTITSNSNQLTSISSTLAQKSTVLAQDTQPSTNGRVKGDMWLDTAHGNHPYRWDGSAWVSAQDENKNKTFVQDTAPTATAVGDLWFDSSNNNRQFRWDGENWNEVSDNRISTNATAISSLDTRVTNAEGTLTAQATQLTNLQSDIDSIGSSSALSELSTQVTQNKDDIQSQSQAITDLNSAVGDKASATAVNSLTTRVSNAEGTISSQTDSISSLSTTVGNHTASINSQQSSINGLELKASLTLDSNGYVTGWSLNNNGNSGSMVIVADKFQITSPGGGARTEYSGGNWRVYDSSGTLRVRLGVW